MKRGAIIVLCVIGLSLLTMASTGAQLANVSGPEFLRGIGPTEPRVDNPIASGITAVAVTVVILRGLYKDKQNQ